MRTRSVSQSLSRLLVGVVLVGGSTVALALPASAHVDIEEGEQAAGSYAVLTFGVPHGCEESPTTRIRIQLPESIPTVTPTVNPGWDIELVKATVDPPIEQAEGEAITERITEVDYTAKVPLSPEFRDALQLSVHIPDDAAGTTLHFPVIQECVEGRTDWTQIPAEGQAEDEVLHPAPAVEVVAATGGDGHGDSDEPETFTTIEGSSSADEVAAAAADDDDDSDSSSGLATAGVVTGVVGMLLGGGALAASKKSR